MSKKKIPVLIVERVNCRENFIFLSLLEYKKENYLCLIDNIDDTSISAYVFDHAEQNNLPMGSLLSLAVNWFYSKSEQYPVSVEFARHGMTELVAPIYKTFDLANVSRIVGHSFSFKQEKTKVKRKRITPLQEGIPIILRRQSQKSE
jgi:hypothetical protein